MKNQRFDALNIMHSRKPVAVSEVASKKSEIFGKDVFTLAQMKRYLSKSVYESVVEAIEHGRRIDRSIADQVAEGMKVWAMERGATHYTHWFQPLNDSTAEKHDAFLNPDLDGESFEYFSGNLLSQQEPDASSFPSGGLRNTFEARGYSAWDPSSPAFIIDGTLCIPSIFVSYTGEALDFKTPLLKSMAALDKAAVDVCQLFDKDVTKVFPTLGWEQEYFLVDEALYAARPDMVMTGRTLMGHDSAKNQQMDDHYFGSIPSRVEEFMKDIEIQALELGIPCKTRHNEVAPNQFELAPIFEETNLAVDHNMLMMSLMKRVARKHGFRCLLHEKPFKGINGSGKHNNWSLSTDTGILLHAPGKTPMDNLRFVTFTVETLKAVLDHNGLLKASIMSASNAHRLGANEAPPAIISSFLGKNVTELLDIVESADLDSFLVEGKTSFKLDLPSIPELFIDNTDRNRTSPFAFTGNRFEFRAVGSEANCASAMLTLNAAVAEALNSFKSRVDALIAAGEKKEAAIIKVVREDIGYIKPIIFNGNGYGEEWKQEAVKRGLDCETSAPKIFDNYLSESSIRMFESTHVLSRHELEARNEIKWETYTKKIQIESRIFGDLCLNHIIPVVTRYQSMLIDNVHKVKDIFPADKADAISKENIIIIEKISKHESYIIEKVDAMIEARKVANRIASEREKAIAYHDTVAPLMEDIRYHVDKLETIVDDEAWPLPKYRELLFIR